MRIGESYRQHGIGGDFDAIVIGSGMGGLSSAALLARHDRKRVVVLERHYTAGGFTHTFHRPGYEWDVGVHYVGQVMDPASPARLLFDDITNAGLEWADMGEVYDKVVIGDDAYEFPKGEDAFRERMQGYFPSERQAIDGYLHRVRSVVSSAGLFFAEKSLPQPISRVLGGAMRWPLLRHARKTTRETLESLTGNPRLIGVLTGQYGDYGLPPSRSSFFIHAMIAAHYMEGAAYPIGGASRIAATILPVIESAGGRILTSAEVEEILVQDDRAVGVRLTDGHELRAPVVISDAGVATTYRRFLPPEARSRHGLDAVVDRHEPSFGHLSLYLGFRATASELGLTRTNLWIYPHHDHDRNLERFVADIDAPLPVVYFSFPSAKDPDFQRRYPGRATVELITLAPYAWFRKWENEPWKKRGDDYREMKGRLTERLLQALYAHYPQLRGKVDHAELSTPLSTRHFTGHRQGEIYGLAATPSLFADRDLRPRTPIRGLFLTGADVATLGVAGALFGGMLTAAKVLGRDLRRAIARGAEEARGARRTAAVA
jgi:all-trans-retinol 13,14-reductase